MSSLPILVHLPLIFWAAMLVPGFAVARRWMSDELEGGLLPGLAVSWATSFAVLAPFIVACYLIGTPIWLPVVVVAAFILWGFWEIGRTRAWRGVGRLLLLSIGIEVLIVAADAYLSARHGSILAADARVHVARIRFLYEHGLSNLDPFVAGSYPYPIYHTNLHHALFAIGSRLTGTDPVVFWFGSLAAAKVMIASGMAYLAWAVLGGRWAAWVAAVMVLVDRGPVTFSLYPNQLAPWFLLPIFLGVLARCLGAAWREPDAAWWHRLPRVAAAALLLGMFHPLYAGFAVVISSPVLLGTAAWRLVRGRPNRAAAGTAALAWLVVVLFAMPFPFAGKRMTVRDREAPPDMSSIARQVDSMGGGQAGVEIDDRDLVEEPVAVERPAAKTRTEKIFSPRDGYVVTQRGDTTWFSRELGRGFTGAYGRGAIKAWRVLVIIAGLGIALWVVRRREAWYLVAAIAVVQGIVLTPPVCTLALRFLGAQWMLQRFETTSFVMFFPLSMPVVAAALETTLGSAGLAAWLRDRTGLRRLHAVLFHGRVVLTVLTLLAIPLAMAHATHRRPYDWEYYWNRVSAPLAYRHGRELRPLLRLQSFLQERIPAGAVVAVDAFTGTRLRMLHDITLVASERSSTGVADGGRRRIDLKLMFALATEEADRGALFDKYGVTHYIARGSLRPWMDWWDAEIDRRHGYTIATLAETPDLTQVWRRQLKLGVRKLLAKRYDEAAEALEEVVLEDPRLEKAWFHLGRALSGRGDAVGAAEAFERAAALDPVDPRYPLMAGNAWSSAERHPAALDAFDRARRVALEGDDPGQAATAVFNMGNTWYRLDDLAEAVASYELAIELDETYDRAREYRDIVMEIMEERRSEEGADPDQSEDTAGRPARSEENTPSERPTP